MQPIGDYLKKLLYQYDCIVVPTLGAFLTHSVSASFNEATGQFLPPRRKVAFNEALMLDDGILLNYVMLHEGITRDEALRGINAFVAMLKEQAHKMGSFSIEGLGLFSYNAENRLQFDPELRHNFLGTTYGMQPVMLASKVVHLAKPVVAVKPLPVQEAAVRQLPATASVSTTALATTTEAVDGQVLSMPVRRSAIVWRWAAAALLVGSLGVISYFSVIRPGDPLQSSLNPAALFRVPSFLLNESAEPSEPVARPMKKSVEVLKPVEPVTVTPIPSAAPVPVAVASSKEAAAPAKESVRKTEVSAVEPSNVSSSAVDASPAVKTNFTVIAGSFASRRNAVRFQKRLVRAGYSDAYIVQGRGLIKVAAIGTESLSEAEGGIDSLHSLTGITPWIMRNDK
ncbi:HU domain-containing protein [Fibrivirga algicola]|uniref:SPOR domain-containing protein n=1 Tax=Fibrivirga algicola TaxID=2950420 RepID=A0ABX0QJ40_9BACT|nr:SPOR domain-containing protein [Fibrivirga algicola]NID12440.1 SPOR domain-containing protein [Fibrivirga algicola]